VECGNPATLGWQAEESSGKLVPICDDCIRATKVHRDYLTSLSREGGR
jgi:hypothetical protein